MKHTPGPWEINEEKINSKQGNIATCNELNRIANAHLIASAPELLEACKWALKMINYLATDVPYGVENKVLKQAIAKAESK